jgi:phytoene dehydrogenase-like protein
MSDRSIIIIGGGLAGLAAGCYARMNGFTTRIFEHHTLPGGVCTAWRRGDFLFDGCIYWLMHHRPGATFDGLYRELGITPHVRLLDITEYMRFVDEPSGKEVAFTSDLDRLAADLKQFAPGDAALIDDLIRGMRAFMGVSSWELMSTPPELVGFFGRLRQMWPMRKMLKYFGGKYNQTIAEYAAGAKDPWLRTVLTQLFLPEVPVWFVLMILGALGERQLSIPEAGSLEFARAVEQRYLGLGGEITYGATVESILVENDRAVGVRLADGSEHRADLVISAADGHSTIFDLLGGRYISDRIKDRYDKWPIFPPLIMVSFGVARDLTGEPPVTALALEHPFTVGRQEISTLQMRLLNHSGAFAPGGKGVVQVVFPTSWEYWSNLRTDPARYQAEKDHVAREALARLEGRYPGISAQVEVTDVATPHATWHYTRNWKGAFEGWLPTPETIRAKMDRTLPGLENFYMAGQWVSPGGGVSSCLISGRQAIQVICHREGRPFTAVASSQ